MLVPFEKKVLCTIWLLANKASYREVGNLFNLQKSSVGMIFHEICSLLASCRYDLIKWPTINEQETISQKTYAVYKFPNVIGYIDGCHIQIKAPANNPHDFYNRKEQHSVVLQGVCDDTLKFIDIYLGQTGRAHDARIFRESPLFDYLEDSTLPKFHILGDSAYPLKNHVMTPFRDDGHLTEEQVRYNVMHARARSCIERAFGRLKNKFRRLKFLELHVTQNITTVLCASCVLHNYIIMKEAVPLENDINDGAQAPDINFPDNTTPAQKRDIITQFINRQV